MRLGKCLSICMGLLLLTGCATTEVPAWQKQHLARASMALDRAPLERGFFQHSYESKEAASGGRGVGGGGCGCN
jgi:hypothetical protein